MVTGTEVPRTPEFGETRCDGRVAIVNVTALLVPPGVVTVMFLVPDCCKEADLERRRDRCGVDHRDPTDSDTKCLAKHRSHVDR